MNRIILDKFNDSLVDLINETELGRTQNLGRPQADSAFSFDFSKL